MKFEIGSPVKFPENIKPAGFWLRFFSYVFDLCVLSILFRILFTFTVMPTAALVTFLISFFPPTDENMLVVVMIVGILASTIATFVFLSVLSFLYFPLFESSRFMGTPGKRLFNLIVLDIDSQPLSFLRAFGRNLCRNLPFALFVMSLLLGVLSRAANIQALSVFFVGFGVLGTVILTFVQYPMAAFTKRKQALHDICANTLVLRSSEMGFLQTFFRLIVLLIVIVISNVEVLPPQTDSTHQEYKLKDSNKESEEKTVTIVPNQETAKPSPSDEESSLFVDNNQARGAVVSIEKDLKNKEVLLINLVPNELSDRDTEKMYSRMWARIQTQLLFKIPLNEINPDLISQEVKNVSVSIPHRRYENGVSSISYSEHPASETRGNFLIEGKISEGQAIIITSKGHLAVEASEKDPKYRWDFRVNGTVISE